jgi:hypothetical protein
VPLDMEKMNETKRINRTMKMMMKMKMMRRIKRMKRRIKRTKMDDWKMRMKQMNYRASLYQFQQMLATSTSVMTLEVVSM